LYFQKNRYKRQSFSRRLLAVMATLLVARAIPLKCWFLSVQRTVELVRIWEKLPAISLENGISLIDPGAAQRLC
jgi:hypothetical protein